MSRFSGFAILDIVLVLIGAGLLLRDLYSSYNHGKNIIKLNKSFGFTIFWVVSLIFWCFLSWFDIKLYIEHDNNRVIDNILINVFWIEFSISNIIRAVRSSEIRENGIYKSGYFYKWSKINSYQWASSDTIEFKVNTLFKNNSVIKFAINEDDKLKVDEAIQRKIVL